MKLIAIGFLSAILISCSASKKSQSAPENSLQGSWEWTASSFVTRGMKEPKLSSPESLGYTIQLNIRETEIDIIKNGKKAATVNYRIEKSLDGKIMIWVDIPQDDFPFYIASGPVYFKADEMQISGGYNDAGENQTYKRIE